MNLRPGFELRPVGQGASNGINFTFSGFLRQNMDLILTWIPCGALKPPFSIENG